MIAFVEKLSIEHSNQRICCCQKCLAAKVIGKCPLLRAHLKVWRVSPPQVNLKHFNPFTFLFNSV